MRLLINLAIAIAIAVIVGFGSAALVLDRERLFGAVTRGAWTAWPDTGSADADPYTAAMLARTGEVPLGAGEGLAFSADADGAGARLTGGCTYRITGQTPPARLWTLTVYDADGHLMDNPARRTAFHSREVLRHEDGSFTISVSRAAQPGNWLPVTTTEGIRLILRLYDTPLAGGARVGAVVMPEIAKAGCP
ncbi:DUF1214 domain-containing protein [Kaistia nematophila]|uniref:DUF1214 domain-containing protein n=1 Tax=Kaistia nematophila TaxID=2994654 RepID=A0A9X3E6T7_9HYPH|nr:DUF1214 domain-containing protein [Kaistia nematophila]MCX5572183.1 DUF1214 domain-containing protein [Kaistia nematophila]